MTYQAPLSIGVPRQECWTGLPFSMPGGPPHPGVKPKSPVSPALADAFFTAERPGKPLLWPKTQFIEKNISRCEKYI